jgi:hypothetical protein
LRGGCPANQTPPAQQGSATSLGLHEFHNKFILINEYDIIRKTQLEGNVKVNLPVENGSPLALE